MGGYQRARILDAVVCVLAERGFAGVTVEEVLERAHVSRGSFYAQFEGLRECLFVIMDESAEYAGMLIGVAFAEWEDWREGVCHALAALLAYFDAEPVFARVSLLEVVMAGSWALEYRERKIAVLRELIVSSWSVQGAGEVSPVRVEAVMGSVLGLLQTRVLEQGERRGSLVGVLGELMGVIVGPFMAPAGIAREVARGEALAREIEAGAYVPVSLREEVAARSPPCCWRTARDARTRPRAARWPDLDESLRANDGEGAGVQQARECLCFVGEHPGVSNAQIAAGIGVGHPSQISRLLRGLSEQGLVLKRSEGPGKPNAWRLTATGARHVCALRRDRPDRAGENRNRDGGS